MHRARLPLFVLLLVCTPIHGAPLVGASNIPNDRSSVEHALNRLAFGPRQGEVERVLRAGLSQWIDRQLNPSNPDDRSLDQRLPAQPAPPERLSSPREARQFARQSVEALAEAKIVRAVHSEQQLQEVLTDFWFNHFNVFAGKGRTGLYVAEYERDAIRPHVLGRFRDLLGATAKSPAMLFYLDNWLSVDPEAAERRARRNAGADQGRRRGLNENYARELLELHTLGVDGGYTQNDIVSVARAFTGWTIARPGQDSRGARRRTRSQSPPETQTIARGEFRFVSALHDPSEKVVLGQRLPRNGAIDEGERVLDIVASHPSTARHIATKLARRFVSDDPPEALVARVAARFRETHGDLREVMRTLVTSPEFFDAAARGAKMKTPFEFVVSAMRTTGHDAGDARVALAALRQLGMPLYMCQPPTGYDDTAEAWTSAGGLVERMNVAQRIARADAAAIGGPDFQRR